MNFSTNIALAAALTATIVLPAAAHDGRRFDVQLDGATLVAQGSYTGGSPMETPGDRPYSNALHDHFAFAGAGASATLPGYDIIEPGALAGGSLTWTLTGARVWQNTPVMPTPQLELGFVPLDQVDGQQPLRVSANGQTITSDAGGSLLLAANIPAAGLLDIDLVYQNPNDNTGSLYLLESLLTATDAAGETLVVSDTVYTVLSPGGDNGAQRRHHLSLYVESVLGTPVPEPASLAVLAMGAIVLVRRGGR